MQNARRPPASPEPEVVDGEFIDDAPSAPGVRIDAHGPDVRVTGTVRPSGVLGSLFGALPFEVSLPKPAPGKVAAFLGGLAAGVFGARATAPRRDPHE